MEIAIIILAVLCVALLIRDSMRSEKRLQDLDQRIRTLEAANRQRLPYKSFEEILNANAALDKDKAEMQFFVSLIENAQGHLANAMKVGTVREDLFNTKGTKK